MKQKIVTMGWEHNKLFNDWSMTINLPHRSIHGVVSYSNQDIDDFGVWGTIQIEPDSKVAVYKYDSPPIAIDAITGIIISIMANRIRMIGDSN